MNIRTETSHHDISRDDEEKFGRNYEDIFGKAWYERVDESKDHDSGN
jgi:hypothetical protein